MLIRIFEGFFNDIFLNQVNIWFITKELQLKFVVVREVDRNKPIVLR